mmetsp:Transcript_21251/g.67278  ORF Transcript_21251/g.67278 Transcript_21251/m.67278 type:complete len:126 (+) Transcript_21251:243-620(+)
MQSMPAPVRLVSTLLLIQPLLLVYCWAANIRAVVSRKKKKAAPAVTPVSPRTDAENRFRQSARAGVSSLAVQDVRKMTKGELKKYYEEQKRKTDDEDESAFVRRKHMDMELVLKDNSKLIHDDIH